MDKQFDYFEKVSLKNGTELTVRTITKRDIENSFYFLSSMPKEQKQFLRIDVCNKEVVEKRYENIEKGKTIRLIAECKGKIIGEVSLERMRYGWLKKSGEVRILVLPEYADLMISEILAREIFLLAARKGLNTLLARVMDSQKDLYEIFKGLNFKHEATQKNHVLDMEGNMHDIFLMTFDLRKMWHDMEMAINEFSQAPMEF